MTLYNSCTEKKEEAVNDDYSCRISCVIKIQVPLAKYLMIIPLVKAITI